MINSHFKDLAVRLWFYKTLGAKLFYLSGGLVMITIAINSLQNARAFQQFLDHYMQDTTLLQTNQAANAAAGVLENWTGQIATVMHGIQGNSESQANSFLQNFMDSNKEYISIQILQQQPSGDLKTLYFAFRKATGEPRYGEQSPPRVINMLSTNGPDWLKRSIVARPDEALQVLSFSKELSLSTLSLAISFKNPATNEILWSLLTVWQSRLAAVLPRNKSLSGRIVDNSGNLFSALDEEAANQKTGSPLLDTFMRSALQVESPQGVKTLRTENGTDNLGAFVKLSRYGLCVLVLRDGSQQYETIMAIIKRTALWGWLLVLISVFISFWGSSGITKNLRDLTKVTERLAAGDFSASISPRTGDEVGLLTTTVNTMAAQISRLLVSEIEKVRYENELETARLVQSTFFPKQEVTTRDIVVSGFYQPSTECGGDWWGHFRPTENLECIYIGDVMGHGVPAALVAAMAYSSCMTEGKIALERKNVFSPSLFLQRFNKILCESATNISMTFLVAYVDLKAGVMHYANAGHCPPVLLRRGKTSLVNGTGDPLGISSSTVYQDYSIPIEAGDQLVLYTDGLIEGSPTGGRPWGKKRLLKCIAETTDPSPATLKTAIIENAFSYTSLPSPTDDVTIVVTKINEAWSTRKLAASA